MAYRIIIRDRALDDLRTIVAWYAATSTIHVRDRLEREFETAWEHLSEWPYIGRAGPNAWHSLALARFPYTTWYRVFDDAGIVRIRRILHDRDDPLKRPD